MRFAVMSVLILPLLITSANAARPLPPGHYNIRITSQVIKQDHPRSRLYVTASALYNKGISPYAIGNSVSRCTLLGPKRTLPDRTMICTYVFRMPLGQIIASGVVTSSVYYRLAVTGGTGVYANSGGQVQGIATKLRPHKERLVFALRTF